MIPQSVRSPLDRQWIKANVIGCAANALAGLFSFGVNQVFVASDGGSGTVGFTIYAVLSVAAAALGYAVYGYLTGIVLRQKLPAFPMRSWLTMYTVWAIGFGALLVYSAGQPASTDADPALDVASRAMVFGAFIGGAMLGGFAGALQAVILRNAARGLGLWIEMSAIAGAVILAADVSASFLAPMGSFANEVITESVNFAASVVAAYIMLPALWRLAPR